MTKEEFKSALYNALADKAIFSNISGSMVEVVRSLPADIVKGKALFDGMMLFDGIDNCIEDDIQQTHAVTKEGVKVNLEDYYTENGAFEDDSEEQFLVSLGNLMTRHEYAQADKQEIRRASANYQKQREQMIKAETIKHND